MWLCSVTLSSKRRRLNSPLKRLIRIVLSWGGAIQLARALGSKHAKELVMTGKRFSATEAERFGLINRIVPRAVLMSETLKFAAELAAKPINALKMAKMVVNLSLETGDMDAALAIERGAISVLFG